MANEHPDACGCKFCGEMKNRIGDRGQRYEVIQIKFDGSKQVWGWTNEDGGGSLASAVRMHPNTMICRVVDRGEAVRDGK